MTGKKTTESTSLQGFPLTNVSVSRICIGDLVIRPDVRFLDELISALEYVRNHHGATVSFYAGVSVE